jgi:hypothetical protein
VLNVWMRAMAKIVAAVISTMPGASAAIPSPLSVRTENDQGSREAAIQVVPLRYYA